jgi:Na+/H+-dicarboxylate symporter
VSGPAGAAAAAVTGAFVAALTAIVAQIHALDAHIAALLRAARLFGRDRGLSRPVPHP